MSQGAGGFLLKDAGPELLLQAVRAAADGEALIAPSVTVRLLAAFADVPTGRPAAQPIAPITAREEEVLLAVARGLGHASMPQRSVSARTCESAREAWRTIAGLVSQ